MHAPQQPPARSAVFARKKAAFPIHTERPHLDLYWPPGTLPRSKQNRGLCASIPPASATGPAPHRTAPLTKATKLPACSPPLLHCGLQAAAATRPVRKHHRGFDLRPAKRPPSLRRTRVPLCVRPPCFVSVSCAALLSVIVLVFAVVPARFASSGTIFSYACMQAADSEVTLVQEHDGWAQMSALPPAAHQI